MTVADYELREGVLRRISTQRLVDELRRRGTSDAHMLTFSTLRSLNVRRSARWHGATQWSLSDWATATVGELGEACNVIKKLNRLRDGLVGNQERSTAALSAMLAKELADTQIYLDLLAYEANIDLAQAVIEKFNEVSERNGFPERL